MSTTTTATRRLPRRVRTPPAEPRLFRVMLWMTVLCALLMLGVGIALSASTLGGLVPDMAVWAGLVAVVGLVPIPTGYGLMLDMSLPLLLAAAFIFGPVPSGVIAFIGTVDIREFRRELPPLRALFNRSEVCLSVMAAAAVFDAFGTPISRLPLVLVPAFLSLLADYAVNFGLVGLAASVLNGIPWRRVVATMRFGRPLEFLVGYVSFGYVGLLLAQIHAQLGGWGLTVFVTPVLLARQAFSHARRVEEQENALRVKEQVLERMARRIADERSDERHRIASSLHDDVLQSLYNVTLHAQVVREDLRSGQLLQLDEDVPGLLRASEAAAKSLRDVIRDLRRSPIGRSGLEDTLKLLVDQLRGETGLRIDAHIDPVGAAPSVQLVAYQVAKEALVNALKHSHARSIVLHLSSEGDDVRLAVTDDGVGFVMSLVDTEAHFGLAMMRERAEMVGGVLSVDSQAGGGTTVSARFPRAERNKQTK